VTELLTGNATEEERQRAKQETDVLYADYEACKRAYAEAVELMKKNGTPRAVIALYVSLAKTFFAENDLAIANNIQSSSPYVVHKDGTLVDPDPQSHFHIGMNQHTGEIKVDPPYRGSYDREVIEGREHIRITKGSKKEAGLVTECDLTGRPIEGELTTEEIARIKKASDLIRKIYERGGRGAYSIKELDGAKEGWQRIRFPSQFAQT